ncbi:DNA-binding protein RFX2-like [Panonychus citri]|uniref:DNA-binding protein RFX2-like n=1 Tax=Panonychus citri TaxID=50023 RepID=UPI002307C738|nr:DNA-binding protein RFX2-like [Panonychus citri]XP_053205129.1 DNA-binding protein RFX2-like [Panonychus citri]
MIDPQDTFKKNPDEEDNNLTTIYYTTDPYTSITCFDNNSTVIYSQVTGANTGGDTETNSGGIAVVSSAPIGTVTAPSNFQIQNVRDTDIVHVRWLIENYETAEGISLPRSTLYSHYQTHCSQQGIEPVNAASFGKLIRSVFVGLRTRRLGTRGNSKYHYYGIRVKPGSPLARITDSSSVSSPDSGQPSAKRHKTVHSDGGNSSSGGGGGGNGNGGSGGGTESIKDNNVVTTNENHQATLTATSPELLQSYLGDPKSILANVWPEEPVPCNDAETPSALATRFAAAYRKHYEQVINAIGNLNFTLIEGLWKSFWQADGSSSKGAGSNSENESNNSTTINTNNKNNKTPGLTLEQLHQLTSSPGIEAENDQEPLASLSEWILQTDYTLYNSLISALLLPNLLKPIPQQLTQQIRNFAKNIHNWMGTALVGYDGSFVTSKLAAVGAFSHTLRRYTSLNHLSSAAQAVLQNQQQIQQMISDLNRVDFKNVQEQASWVCQCDDSIVDQIEQSFKILLQEPNPFDRWGLWCEQVLDTCLRDNDVRSATQFFFKWGFYSSLVMRDLTLRSASSFGSFHLIRLLFDEYIFYLIEHRVAQATGKTPLQVLGEVRMTMVKSKDNNTTNTTTSTNTNTNNSNSTNTNQHSS